MATQNFVKHTDLTDEQIAHVKKKIITQAQKDEYFDQFCEHENWEAGSNTMNVRRLIYPKVSPDQVKPATEGVAPRPTKIEYATYKVAVADYRDRFNYTDESVRYNFDDVVRNGGSILAYAFKQKLDYIKGKPFISSKATLTAETGTSPLIKTMRKAKIVLGKNEAKKWSGANFLMIATPETIEILQDELEAKGSALDEATKEELAQGAVYRKKGFMISECSSDLLQKSSTHHYVIFLGRTPDGRKPVTCRKMGDVQVINNPLGSGVLPDEDGNITDDANHQVGSVAMNALGLGAHISDDMCILVCEFPVTTIAGTNLTASGRTGYVSSSSSPAEE